MISIQDLFKQSWGVYKQGFWFFAKLMGINLLAFLCMIPFGALFAAGVASERFYFAAIAAIIFLAVLLAVVIACLCLHIGLLLSIRDRNFTSTVKEYFDKAKALVVPFAWVSILSGLVVMLGFVVFIIPGIIFAIWFGFAKFAVIADDKKGVAALSYSKSLVKGNFWPVLGRIALLVLLAMLLSMIKPVGFFINLFFTTPFAAIYMYLIYEELKKGKALPV